MLMEILLYTVWAHLWVGLDVTICTLFPTFNNYSKSIQNNMFSMVHAILSCFLAGNYLYNTHNSANQFLYDYALSNHTLMNTSLNTSLYPGTYSYRNMLEVYNHVSNPWSLSLLSLQAMSVCYFVMDIIYLIKDHSIFSKSAYIYHHILMLLLHYYAYTSENTYEYIWLLYYGELSNIFTYITYHLIKIKNKQAAYISSLIQCAWFAFYRVFVYSSFLIPFLMSVDSILMRLLLPSIYVMGIMWWYNLCENVSASLEEHNHLQLFQSKYKWKLIKMKLYNRLYGRFKELWNITTTYATTSSTTSTTTSSTTTPTTPATSTTTSTTTPMTTSTTTPMTTSTTTPTTDTTFITDTSTDTTNTTMVIGKWMDDDNLTETKKMLYETVNSSNTGDVNEDENEDENEDATFVDDEDKVGDCMIDPLEESRTYSLRRRMVRM